MRRLRKPHIQAHPVNAVETPQIPGTAVVLGEEFYFVDPQNDKVVTKELRILHRKVYPRAGAEGLLFIFVGFAFITDSFNKDK